jgi:hypothetical protein
LKVRAIKSLLSFCLPTGIWPHRTLNQKHKH